MTSHPVNDSDYPYATQLQMVWPVSSLDSPPAVDLPESYSLRTFEWGDQPRFYELMALAGWPEWDDDRLQPWLERILPRGWFMAVYEPDDLIVSSFEGDGAGGFSLHDLSIVHASRPSAIAVGRIDGDDLPDILVGTCGTRCGGPGGTDLYILAGEAGGVRAARALELRPGIDRQYTDIAVRDLDGDGSDEVILLARGRDNAVEVYRRNVP